MIRSMVRERHFEALFDGRVQLLVRKYVRYQKLDPGKEEVEWSVGFTRTNKWKRELPADAPIWGSTVTASTLRKSIGKARLEISKELIPGFKKVDQGVRKTGRPAPTPTSSSGRSISK